MRKTSIKIKKLFSFLNFKYKSFGKRSYIYKPIIITNKKFISIGNNVSFSNFARIEAIMSWGQQQLKPLITIGNNTHFEESAHLISTAPLNIGNNCVFSSRVFITTCHHSFEKIDTSVFDQELTSKSVSIEDCCFIGMDVKIFPGVNIGKNVIVGANSIVINDLPNYTVCVGAPAKPIKKYDFERKEWIKL